MFYVGNDGCGTVVVRDNLDALPPDLCHLTTFALLRNALGQAAMQSVLNDWELDADADGITAVAVEEALHWASTIRAANP